MFIKVHAHNKATKDYDKVLVNMAVVQSVFIDNKGNCRTLNEDESTLRLKESFEEIEALINAQL